MTVQKTVLITGAAGHLGAAVAEAFSQSGARLVLLDRDANALKQRLGHLPNAELVAVDLLAREQVKQQVAAAIARVGRIHAVCHLAGGFRMGESVHETTASTWDFLIDLNAGSLFNVAAAVVPHLLENGGGHVVTVGAGAALKGGANMGAYSASKSALIRLTESMSAELKDKGINVNCVLPSIIDTPINRADMPDADFSRWVSPQDLANVIVFLASDASRAIHGASIPVGGLVA